MTKLARHLTLGALIIYGVGDILGAGIYALVGKIIGIAGSGAWMTFLLAAVLALITGLSYAELTARYPVSAGAAVFVRRAFPGKLIATLAGVIVLGTGLASAATVAVAFGQYLSQLIPIPEFLSQLLLVFGISFLSYWGIQESSRVNIFLTFVEVSGLLLVIIVGAYFWFQNSEIPSPIHTELPWEWKSIVAGVTLAFYAYIGFEDLANLAEECRNPQKDLPKAILIAISITTAIYILVTVILMVVIPIEEIQQSPTPLLLVFQKTGIENIESYFTLVALLAIMNTGLINIIMASRLMYGMAEEKLLPEILGKIHEKRQTPWIAVITALLVVLLLVFTGGLKILAQTTSLLIIVVFCLVHLSLIKIKLKNVPFDGIQFPIIFPIIGVFLSIATLTQFHDPLVWLRSLIVISVGLLVWFLQTFRKTNH